MVNPRTKKMGPSIPASAQNWRAIALFNGGRSGFVVPGIIVAPLACAYDIVQSAFPPDMPPLEVGLGFWRKSLRDSRKLNYPRDDRVRSFERYVKRGYSAERGSERTANLAAVSVPETGV